MAMATVRLSRVEVEDELLPPVCMKCGEDATLHKYKTFAWHPSWAIAFILLGLLPYAIAALLLTKRMTIQAPLCAQHRGHWTVRACFMWGGLGFLLLLGVLVIGFAIANERQPGGEALMGFACVGGFLVGLLWLIAAAILQHTGIRPQEITDRSITLTNVSPEFEDALWDERDQRRARREQRRRQIDRDEDSYAEPDERDSRPPRKKPRRTAGDDEAFYEPDER